MKFLKIFKPITKIISAFKDSDEVKVAKQKTKQVKIEAKTQIKLKAINESKPEDLSTTLKDEITSLFVLALIIYPLVIGFIKNSEEAMKIVKLYTELPYSIMLLAFIIGVRNVNGVKVLSVIIDKFKR